MYLFGLMCRKEVGHQSPGLDSLHQVIGLHFLMLSLSQLNRVLRELRSEGHSLSLKSFHFRLFLNLQLRLGFDSIDVEQLKFLNKLWGLIEVEAVLVLC